MSSEALPPPMLVMGNCTVCNSAIQLGQAFVRIPREDRTQRSMVLAHDSCPHPPNLKVRTMTEEVLKVIRAYHENSKT